MSKNRLEVLELIDGICEQFESLLIQSKEADISDWIKLVDEDDRPELFLELLRLETHHSTESLYSNSIGDYFRKFPEFSNEIVKVFASNRESETGESNPHTRPNADLCNAGDKVDRFEIISVLGAGGFSAVYLARDPERSQAIALKVLHPQSGPDDARNFECIVNEANVLSCIDHLAIPKVFDVGEAEDGRPWVSMEFIKGESLYKSLATDELSLTEVLTVLVKTAHALHEVHEAGFSHRDIKPDNIIIGLDGEPRILDFGLALHENLQRDKSGERAGTTAFMSPEQVQGQSEDLDGRTDIWSLGVVLYLVIAKRLPFHGETKEDVRREIVKRPVKPPRQIKNNIATFELEKVCLRALNKKPEDRFSTAKDFANELQLAVDALPADFLLEDISRTRRLTKSERSQVELARQARIWNAEPAKENLPGLFQYFRFISRSKKKLWTDSESAMMKAAFGHIRKVFIVVASVAMIFAMTYVFIERLERNAKIQRLIVEIGKTPISEVVSKFEAESSFAPQECLDAVRAAEIKTSSDEEATAEHLRYAIILSPSNPEFEETFKKSLIDAKPEEIETLSNLVFTDRDTNTIPSLDDESRQRLRNIISNTSYVSGIENIWTNVPLEKVQEFEQAGGTITERYAIAPRMTVDKFKTIAEEFREYRYRPVCVRTWTDAENVKMLAAIWHRCSADWKISWSLSPSEFLELKSKEPMHLVDVSDGLQGHEEPVQLVAVWSSRQSLFGEARHQLLAFRIPQLSDPNWQFQNDPNIGLITKDINTTYLHNAPLLVDVCLHPDIQFTPTPSLEHQKLSVGELILRAYQTNYETIPGTPEHHRLEVGAKMKAEAFYALERFDDSSDHFLRKTEEGNWPEIWTRTLSFAKSNDVASANHSMALLKKKLHAATKYDAKPYATYGVATAIVMSVQDEMDFWEDKDAARFISKVKDRIRRVEGSRTRGRVTLWAEYYAMALTTRSVARAVASASYEGSKRDFNVLKKLNKELWENCLELKPSLEKTFSQRPDHILAANGARLTNIFLPERQMPIRSSAWNAGLSNFESTFVEPRTRRPHARASASLDEKGYFPSSIVFGNRLSGNPKIGTVWHRELKTDDLFRREQRLANAFCYALCHDENIGISQVLKSRDNCSLKQRIIDSIFEFKVNVSILIKHIDDTEDSNERLSLLAALRPYSNGHIDDQHVDAVLSSMRRIEQYGSAEERELAKIIQINLTPIPIHTVNTTSLDRAR